MPSILSGFEYDIFISYRQKDNKGGHWVTEFVDALRTELEATFKEDVSIYFDENPHDGLLETHNVDKSLEGKLKCLLFIPIISQTYCDPKSFAWKNEFLAFNKMAKEDQFGREVALSRGNVASRILPVKIHDLGQEDKVIIENELGPLRAIDFIFRSPGVNRPLRPHEENPGENLNRTNYRNQINKLANAVKEIIYGMKPGKPVSTTLSWKPSGSPMISKSIVMLPFSNMSNDPEQEYFSDGLTEEIISKFSKISSLKVISRTSSMHYKGSGKSLKEIALELGVKYVLEGGVRKQGKPMLRAEIQRRH